MASKQDAGTTQRDLSARRVIGFACNQAFVFFLFYLSPNITLDVGGTQIQRFDLLCTLAFMVVGFAAARALGPRQIDLLFSRPLLYVFAIIAAAGSLLSMAFPGHEAQWVVAQGALVGIPIAYLLTAWGRTFGRQPTATSVPEVFLGSLAGALVCLVFSLAAESQVALLLLRILPLASVVNLEVPSAEEAPAPATVDAQSGQARRLSAKILVGTLLFGMSAGLLESAGASGAFVLPYTQVSLVLFGAFLIGSLSLLLSNGFGRGAALNKSYRLAVFLMLVGMLLIPLPALAQSALPGQAVVLAGYLGLETVFIGLFIVLAKVTATDCALSFSRGFSSLFAGELLGAIVANALAVAMPGATGAAAAATTATAAATAAEPLATSPFVYATVALAGITALLSYVFLFTERDFDDLSQIVNATDAFEDTCTQIAQQFSLSKRESEILAFALRGRTSERIAQELVIAKSTVDTHLRRIYSKCGVHSRQELLDLAEDLPKAQ